MRPRDHRLQPPLPLRMHELHVRLMTAITHPMSGRDACDLGLVAIRPRSRKRAMLLHFLATPAGRTVCGRYTFERHTGDERVDAGTPLCRVCEGTHGGHRWAPGEYHGRRS